MRTREEVDEYEEEGNRGRRKMGTEWRRRRRRGMSNRRRKEWNEQQEKEEEEHCFK